MVAVDERQVQTGVLFIEFLQLPGAGEAIGTHHDQMSKSSGTVTAEFRLRGRGNRDVNGSGRSAHDRLKCNVTKHAILKRAPEIVCENELSFDFLLVATKGRSGQQYLPGVTEQIQQSAPCVCRGVMRFVYQHQIEEISRWRRYHAVSGAYAGNSGNHNVILPQILPSLIGAYSVFRRKNSRTWEAKR